MTAAYIVLWVHPCSVPEVGIYSESHPTSIDGAMVVPLEYSVIGKTWAAAREMAEDRITRDPVLSRMRRRA